LPTDSNAPGYLLACACTIFVSAFLLFALEPLIARQILPWFGGSAAVWSTCLVFYQTALLLGYWYARLVMEPVRGKTLNARWQPFVHVALLALSLLALPIGIAAAPRATQTEHPAFSILLLLTRSIGLPFIVLSATTPLLQAWLARSGSPNPYRMFALSNFASLAALLLYPTVIEPLLDTPSQRIAWSALYGVFVLLCAFVALRSGGKAQTASALDERAPAARSSLGVEILWFLLPACSSTLLLAVTNHLDENVAAVPLLWVLPLSAYLLSFICAFGFRKYNRGLWLRVVAFALGIMGYATYDINTVEPIQINLPLFLAALFICCFFCHAELKRLRPPAEALTRFYLLIAAGGAAGAVFVGLIAPEVFSGIYELPLSFLFLAVLAIALIWTTRSWPMRTLWAGTALCMGAVLISDVQGYTQHTLSVVRNFYGTLRVEQTPHAGPQQQRILFHGTVEHGAQFLELPARRRATTYYGPDSGIGIVLRECVPSPRRVAVVGLGAGTLAAYGRAGDDFTFYEINPQVIDIARSLFFYLRESAARTNIKLGDARLTLQAEHGPLYDVLALDAFSGDAIPVHLLTREAMRLYLARLRPGGVLAFHTSNNFLELAPVVKQLADEAGLRTVLVHSHPDADSALLASDWLIATRNGALLENPALRLHAQPVAGRTGLRPWTDNYNNLWQIFKAPSLTPR
jgi:SAM-dependent methyltransferase